MGYIADIILSSDIPADIGMVYDILSDHNQLHQLAPGIIKSVNVRSRRDDTYVAEERLVLGGKEYLCMVRHILKCPDSHTCYVIGGDAKRSMITEQFESLKDQTRVVSTISWRGGLLSRNKRVSASYQDIICKVIQQVQAQTRRPS